MDIRYGIVIKEGKEEVSLDLDQNITSQATSSASLAYMIEKYGGVRNDIMHIFNLEVDKKVILKPYANDAEDFYYGIVMSHKNI